MLHRNIFCAVAEYGRTHSDMRCTLEDRTPVILAHTHGKNIPVRRADI